MVTIEPVDVAGRLTARVRWIAVRGIAAAVSGLLVLGIGGRLVMLASRLLHPDAIGRTTENGNRIGEFTIDGTIGLILFGGVLSGVAAGVIWVLVKQWIPQNWIVVGVVATAIGGGTLIQSDNRDFVIIGDPGIDIILLLGLVFLFGATLLRVDQWLEKRLPPAVSVFSIVVYALLISFGGSLTIPVFGGFFFEGFCFCSNPPIWTGVFMVAAGLVTAAWWLLNSFKDVDEPPLYLHRIGTIAVVLATAAATVYLAGEITTIL